jgi:hypothetical protein
MADSKRLATDVIVIIQALNVYGSRYDGLLGVQHFGGW